MKYTVGVQLLVLFSTLAVGISCDAVTINGQQLSHVGLLAMGFQVRCKHDYASGGLTIASDDKGNITIDFLQCDAEGISNVRNYYNYLDESKAQLKQLSEDNIRIRSRKSLCYEDASIDGANVVALSTEASLSLNNAVVTSPYAYLEGSCLSFENVFFDVDRIIIKSACADSLIASITIEFDRDASSVPLVIGEVDFHTNVINGGTCEHMLCLGARAISLSFAPHAFDDAQADA